MRASAPMARSGRCRSADAHAWRCSMSGQLDSLFGDTKSERTGSVTPPPGSKDAAQMPPDADLAYARAAASALLSRGEKLQHAVGKSRHRRARHRHADCVGYISWMAKPAAISWRASSPAIRRTGCKVRPANKSRARGKCARSSRGSAFVVLFHVPPHSFPLIRVSAGAPACAGMSEF